MNEKEISFNYEGSEDCIRNHFHSFLKGSLVDMMISIKSFRKFVSDCEDYEKNLKKREKEDKSRQKKSDYQFMEDENEDQIDKAN